MKAAAMSTTVSTKGQVILPKVVRDRRGWGVGTRLEIEETADAVVLRPARLFPETRVEDVFGAADYSGPVRSLAEMDAGVMAEARRRARR
ncbi:MAG: AbrB/MazE/SpoVT family DNA-binding domain-containing protein [Caulobacteraceae bacterium]